jgi:hypothetical protein
MRGLARCATLFRGARDQAYLLLCQIVQKKVVLLGAAWVTDHHRRVGGPSRFGSISGILEGTQYHSLTSSPRNR